MSAKTLRLFEELPLLSVANRLHNRGLKLSGTRGQPMINRRTIAALHRRKAVPDLRYEMQLWNEQAVIVAGVDEVGVGPLAGPVVAGAVILQPGVLLSEVRDSKQLNAEQRERLYTSITERALATGVGLASVEEIDRMNIYQATLLAMRRAIEALAVRPQHLLVDGRGPSPVAEISCTRLVGGDRTSLSVAAASILAKVTRDRIMREYEARYPGYGFARHKGYATAQHLIALKRLGASPVHRTSFAPVTALSGLFFKP
jgi:ribonuclease HII